jgi:hypothetical protein
MPSTESARNDLYNGLTDLLGADRAETLMRHLPAFDPSQVATKADLKDLRSDLNARMDALTSRMDRLLLTLAAGLFVIFASVMGVLGVVIAAVT